MRANLERNGAVAVGFSPPTIARAVQVKGVATRVVELNTPRGRLRVSSPEATALEMVPKAVMTTKTVCGDALFAFRAPLRLAPGESVTLMPGDSHAFWGEGGDVLIGEVSTVNDDVTDNIFREKIGRFARVEEDVEPTHLLVSDYDKWL